MFIALASNDSLWINSNEKWSLNDCNIFTLAKVDYFKHEL